MPHGEGYELGGFWHWQTVATIVRGPGVEVDADDSTRVKLSWEEGLVPPVPYATSKT